MGAEARIKELGITLPPPPKPAGNYVPGVRVGNLLFLSGHGPLHVEGKTRPKGKVGREISPEEGHRIAREVGINLLGSTRSLLGSLDKVKRVVKVPSDEQPTSKQTSVTERSPRRSKVMARSMRRVIR